MARTFDAGLLCSSTRPRHAHDQARPRSAWNRHRRSTCRAIRSSGGAAVELQRRNLYRDIAPTKIATLHRSRDCRLRIAERLNVSIRSIKRPRGPHVFKLNVADHEALQR